MSCPPTRTPVRYAAALRSRGRVADRVDDEGRGLARAFEPGGCPSQASQTRVAPAMPSAGYGASCRRLHLRVGQRRPTDTEPTASSPCETAIHRPRPLTCAVVSPTRAAQGGPRSPDREPAAAVDHDLQRSGGRHQRLGHRLRGPHSGSRGAPSAAVAQLHDASLEPGGVLVGSCAVARTGPSSAGRHAGGPPISTL